MTLLNSTNSEIEMRYNELDGIIQVLSKISQIINYTNILPMGVMGPILSVSLLLYTIREIFKLKRRYKAEQILFHADNCSEDELKIRELNYTVNMRKYTLMLLVSLTELACLFTPLAPFVITLLSSTNSYQFVEKRLIKCGGTLALDLMIQHISVRIYIGIARALLFVFLSLLRLLVTYLANVYRERLKYTKFRKHFAWMFILAVSMVYFDILMYTFVPNLFITFLILLIEYVLLWRSLKDLRWATKWKSIDLERDHPNEVKTKSFKMASRVYRTFSHLLSVGIFSMTMSLLIMTNVLPIFGFLPHINCYLHVIYPIESTLVINLTIDNSVLELITQILYLMLDLFVTLGTLSAIYPISLYFALLILNDFVFWLRRRNKEYPVTRPELITGLLEWHRKYYVYRQV